jgi:hypothetical protein
MKSTNNKKPAQADQILAALERGERITSIDALRDFGCFRLSGRIYELRQAGYPVLDTLVSINGKMVARYFLDPDYLAAKRAHDAIENENQEPPEGGLAR